MSFCSQYIPLTPMERKEWKAMRRTRNRITHGVIFTYGRNTKQTGVFKVKLKHKQ